MKGWTRGARTGDHVSRFGAGRLQQEQGGESGANMASSVRHWQRGWNPLGCAETMGPPGGEAHAGGNVCDPRGGGRSEKGECAVFYFGSGRGVTLQSNINRWIGTI